MAAVRHPLAACLVALAVRRRLAVRLRPLLRLLLEVLAMYRMDLERRHRRPRLFNRHRRAALQCPPMRRFRPMYCDLLRLVPAPTSLPQVASRHLAVSRLLVAVAASRHLVVSRHLAVPVVAPVAINRRLVARVQ